MTMEKSTATVKSLQLLTDNVRRVTIRYFGANSTVDIKPSEESTFLNKYPFLKESYDRLLKAEIQRRSN